MARIKTPVVVTANCLRGGEVVYLDANDAWVRALQDAVCFDDIEDAEAALTRTASEAEVIGSYLASVSTSANGVTPVHYREAIRHQGPGAYIANPRRSAHLVSL